MDLLVVGAGVIGSVYGAHFAAAGHEVSILGRGTRSDDLRHSGLVVRDVLDGTELKSEVRLVSDVAASAYDLVLIAVRNDQLASACDAVRVLSGAPTLLFFGNNPAGRSAIPNNLPGTVRLGFPGIGGQLKDGTVEYVRIPQQPTTLEADADPVLDEVEATLRRRGFRVGRVADMDGWLLYHSVFVASVAAALYRCGTDPARLAADREALTLMCRAVTEGFATLRRQGVGGAPGNLAFLHRSFLLPVAARYWARMMRSPMGELCFAAHARHAEAEMRALADAVIARASDRPLTQRLHQLLEQAGAGQARS